MLGMAANFQTMPAKGSIAVQNYPMATAQREAPAPMING
jgi:hypothetical protein